VKKRFKILLRSRVRVCFHHRVCGRCCRRNFT